MTKREGIVILGTSDEDADWIKLLPGHQDEVAIHDALALKLKEEAENE